MHATTETGYPGGWLSDALGLLTHSYSSLRYSVFWGFQTPVPPLEVGWVGLWLSPWREWVHLLLTWGRELSWGSSAEVVGVRDAAMALSGEP
jgi:hypothetical protein